MFSAKLCHPQARTPVRATPGSAGFDVSACEDAVVPPNGGRCTVNTGVALCFPDDCYARVAPRSGLAARCGIDVLAGVVDADYLESIRVILINHGDQPFTVRAGDRIAQLVFELLAPAPMQLACVDAFESVTTHAGFGSTGV